MRLQFANSDVDELHEEGEEHSRVQVGFGNCKAQTIEHQGQANDEYKR